MELDMLHCLARKNSLRLLFWRLLEILALIAVFSTAGISETVSVPQKVIDRDRLLNSVRSEGHAAIIVSLNMPQTRKLLEASMQHKATTSLKSAASAEMTEADKALADHIHTVVQSALGKLEGNSYKVNRTYKLFPLIALDVSEAALLTLESMLEVTSISPDKAVPLPKYGTAKGVQESPSESGLSPKVPQVFPVNSDTMGVGASWAMGYTGRGWYVAILDTGVRTNHVAFAGKDIVEACFAANADCPNDQTTMYGPGAAATFTSNYDGYEHGTHVAGIAAGSSGSYFGVAKDANLIAVEVFTGYTTAQDCGDRTPPCVKSTSSDRIAALEFVYTLRGTYPIAAVNMSLGSGGYSDQTACDTDNAAEKLPIDMLRAAGIATVISSGNDYYCNAVGEPGCISSAISVGAVDDSDTQMNLSNWHYGMLKLLAPGNNIYSAVPDSASSYGYLSGTSMAAPQVTGAWALLRQQDPAANVSDMYYALASSGTSVKSDCPHINDYKPRIQIDAALDPTVLNAPQRTLTFTYSPTASPTFGVSARPVGVGTVSGSGNIIDLRVGFYLFTAPVDIYLALYVPTLDSQNYYMVLPSSVVAPLSRVGLIPWKKGVTGPIDESLFGPVSSSALPSSTYYVYVIVTPTGQLSTFYLWSTDFVN